MFEIEGDGADALYVLVDYCMRRACRDNPLQVVVTVVSPVQNTEE